MQNDETMLLGLGATRTKGGATLPPWLRRGPQRWAAIVLLVGAALRPAGAAPLRAGVHATGGWAEGAAARMTTQLDLGLSPAWFWRFAAGPGYADGQAGAQVSAGPVFALDALTYVPRLALLVGANVPAGRLRLQGGLELMRTLGLHAGVVVGAYATWRPGGQAGGLLAAGAEWEL